MINRSTRAAAAHGCGPWRRRSSRSVWPPSGPHRASRGVVFNEQVVPRTKVLGNSPRPEHCAGGFSPTPLVGRAGKGMALFHKALDFWKFPQTVTLARV